jgi:N-acetylglucosamine-6-phosphate deacetylase
MGECESTLGEFSVIVKNEKAVLKNGGSLAGSALKLIQAVQNVVSWGIAEPSLAIKMASLVPSQSVGLDDVCGHLSSGYNADFIVLDNGLKLQTTYLNGRKVYEKYKGV